MNILVTVGLDLGHNCTVHTVAYSVLYDWGRRRPLIFTAIETLHIKSSKLYKTVQKQN